MTLPFERTLSAPCKVNLTLDVGPTRADGYHDLDSLVVRLSPADEVTVQIFPGTRQVKLLVKDKRPDAVADPPIPRGEENLAHAAARLALETLAPDAAIDVRVRLTKRLPAQAGLGAGSSDAAAVLSVLGEAFGADEKTLLALAARLGSDVAVFLDTTALGAFRVTGRGEVVERAATVPPLWGVLVRPAIGVATGPAYALLDAVSGRTPGTATAALLDALSSRPSPSVEEIGAALGNDFESAVLPGFPEVAEAHEAVRDAGAIRAILCGSGSSVWGLARDREHALEIVRKLVGRFAWVKLAVTV